MEEAQAHGGSVSDQAPSAQRGHLGAISVMEKCLHAKELAGGAGDGDERRGQAMMALRDARTSNVQGGTEESLFCLQTRLDF